MMFNDNRSIEHLVPMHLPSSALRSSCNSRFTRSIHAWHRTDPILTAALPSTPTIASVDSVMDLQWFPMRAALSLPKNPALNHADCIVLCVLPVLSTAPMIDGANQCEPPLFYTSVYHLSKY
ncbi:hypothetical protein J6590_031513 [Homalodisca vitripennis]|nr:hypothetical protein J6590_031513 [Homalodisca vitripennis]